VSILKTLFCFEGRPLHRSIDAACVLEKRGMKSMHIFIKVGKIKVTKIKLLKHLFPLYSLHIIFLEIFSLATLARMRFIVHLKMQACNVLYQPHRVPIYIFLFFGIIIPDCQLPKFTENTHKIVQNVQYSLWGGGKCGEDVRIGARAPWLLGDRRP